MYTYKAKVVSIYDGDTIRADIDLGFGIWNKNVEMRLAGINTPEVRGESKPEGILARDFLRNMILGKDVIIETSKDAQEKYGRYLVTIWLTSRSDLSVNTLLIQEGHAIPYMEG